MFQRTPSQLSPKLFSRHVSRLLLLPFLALIALMLLTLSGCGSSPVTAPDTSSQPGTSQEVPAEEAVPEEAEEEEAPEPWRPEAAISVLSSVHPSSVPAIGVLDGEHLLLLWNDFSGAESVESAACVLDLKEDQVLSTCTFDSDMTLVQTFQDGTWAMRSEEDAYWLVDASFVRRELDLPVSGGLFSPDHAWYYYTEDDLLFRMNLDSGESERVSLQNNLRVSYLEGISPDGAYLTCMVRTSIYTSLSCEALIRPEDGTLVLLSEDLYSVFCDDGHFYGYGWDWDTTADHEIFTLLFGTLPGKEQLYSYTGVACDTPDYTEYAHVTGSGYLFRITSQYPDESSGIDPDEIQVVLSALREDGGVEVCDLSALGLPGPIYNPVYLPDSETIVCSIYENSMDTVVILDPSRLTFTLEGTGEALDPSGGIDTELLSYLRQEQATVDVPDTLQALRQRADGLEQTYGVHILLGEQCAQPCTYSGYEVKTTSGYPEEQELVSLSLDLLEETLELFPEGFFTAFQTAAPEDGLYFLLIGSISSSNSVIGMEFGGPYRKCLAVDVWNASVGTFCHEIWHAAEEKISEENSQFFYSGDWDSLNPEGFEYLYDYDLSQADFDLWQYAYLGEGDPVYFVDDYAQTYPKEDRARIFEYVMGGEESARDLMQSPAIRAKLRVMSNALRTVWDDSGWDNVRWERFF